MTRRSSPHVELAALRYGVLAALTSSPEIEAPPLPGRDGGGPAP